MGLPTEVLITYQGVDVLSCGELSPRLLESLFHTRQQGLIRSSREVHQGVLFQLKMHMGKFRKHPRGRRRLYGRSPRSFKDRFSIWLTLKQRLLIIWKEFGEVYLNTDGFVWLEVEYALAGGIVQDKVGN
ncbi:hypothetical protein J1N35_002115 [Gossypium stocksii]|uniref:Uncharacterized protein n=1 Tax=Gossypium stocksii TaxID=47602 RepID=A0A9D3WJ08_9ROSI|nr:hypothetical protein J1N35_002115 [Gossypium stocksii]